ncbi:MAG: hypothetical protein LBK47_04870 [Prevotellaceae bacterium]|jgi:hypothetical protein|nr:hypothetical protein [Prevotellaceae bacterium]
MKKKTGLICAAALLMGMSLASCSKDDNKSGGEASLPTPTGDTKYLNKYEISNDTLLQVKYAFSGNGLLLADSTYGSDNSGSRYFYETREFIYGTKGLSQVVAKRYKADGTIDNTYDDYNYTTTYTYSGNTIKEQYSYRSDRYNVHYMENGKIVRSEEVGDDDISKYYYTNNDCTKIEYLKVDEPEKVQTTQVNVFDDKKNPFYNNWFAFYYEALGENNLKKSTRTYSDEGSDVDVDVEFLEYNSQGYPTKYQSKNSTASFIYQYIGW